MSNERINIPKAPEQSPKVSADNETAVAEAGTNPQFTPEHLSNIPFDKTSMHEAILAEDPENRLDTTVDTGKLALIAAGEKITPRAPAQESVLREDSPITDFSEAEMRLIEKRRLKQEQGNPLARFYKKPIGKIAVVAASLAVAASAYGIGTSVGASDKTETTPTPNENIATAPAVPGQTENVPTPKAEIKNVPAEAKDFVDQYGDLFSDPVSTYYAQKASAEIVNGVPVILTPEIINGYEFTDAASHPTSEFGFSPAYMLAETRPTSETSVELYNKFFIPWCLNPYLNTIARNPSIDTRKVIDNEYMKFCGAINGFEKGNSRELQRESVQMLLDNLKLIADEYGTTAVFKVADATDQQNDSLYTILSRQYIDSEDDKGVVQMFSSDLALNIDVKQFKGEEVSNKQITTELDRISYHKTFAYTDIDTVQVSIGMRQ